MILSGGPTSIGPKLGEKAQLALYLAGLDPERQWHGADQDFLAINHRLTPDPVTWVASLSARLACECGGYGEKHFSFGSCQTIGCCAELRGLISSGDAPTRLLGDGAVWLFELAACHHQSLRCQDDYSTIFQQAPGCVFKAPRGRFSVSDLPLGHRGEARTLRAWASASIGAWADKNRGYRLAFLDALATKSF
jgi:hypothetical protein